MSKDPPELVLRLRGPTGPLQHVACDIPDAQVERAHLRAARPGAARSAFPGGAVARSSFRTARGGSPWVVLGGRCAGMARTIPGKQKRPPGGGLFQVRECLGGDLLSHPVTRAVPSALEGLTSGFGMGPGVPPPP